MIEAHPGDLLNLQMLKDAIERPEVASLWVAGDHGMMIPHVCETVFGDGLQLLTVSTINQRPNYWVVRVDSRWEQSNFYCGPHDTIGDHIDEVLTAIEDECGEACRLLDEPCPQCDDECCRCDVDSWEAFPAIDYDGGCSWGHIKWPWLMKAVGYSAMIARISGAARDRDGAEGGDANAAPVPQDRQARTSEGGIAQ